jgi:hypothetical protein
MHSVTHPLIEQLVDELQPVQRVSVRQGLVMALSLMTLVTTLVAVFLGVRDDLLMGEPHAMFFLRSGTLLMLGLATAWSVVHMATPGVGNRQSGWIWALGAAALFPLTALILSAIHMPPAEFVRPVEGVFCLAFSSLFALAIGSGFTLWLRQGAPTSPQRAGWLVGIASGALGTAAYNLHCPFNDIYYIGLWFTLAVAIGAVTGRLIVPHFIRW